MTEPRQDGQGVANCINMALADAGIDKEQVNYINAHATSTPAGDLVEINAVKKVFTDTAQEGLLHERPERDGPQLAARPAGGRQRGGPAGGPGPRPGAPDAARDGGPGPGARVPLPPAAAHGGLPGGGGLPAARRPRGRLRLRVRGA